MDYLHQESKNGYTLTVEYEQWADDPTNWGNFTITENTEDMLTDTGKLLPSIQTKLRNGTAFMIDKYEHSAVIYRLAGENRDRWDTSANWGMIEFAPGYIKGVSLDDRREYAKGDLETYTAWANGDVYRADIVEDATGEYIDGSGDCYGLAETIAQGQSELYRLAPVHEAAAAKNANQLHGGTR